MRGRVESATWGESFFYPISSFIPSVNEINQHKVDKSAFFLGKCENSWSRPGSAQGMGWHAARG